ncbi:MAG: OmpA family protein [Flavobacterium sp.]|nr:OmpA family protein [Candidatus Neoflavobacterium equi]
MKYRMLCLLLITFQWLQAQEEIVKSVYFKFDSDVLEQTQAEALLKFVKEIDSTTVESIQIYGYCDDFGKDVYNLKLSTNRADKAKKALIAGGVKNKIIVTIEGKGRILIDDDILDDLPDVRKKNRRVDVVVKMKEIPPVKLPGLHYELAADMVVGDRIYLEQIVFERGSSQLTAKSKVVLEKLAAQLLKFKNLCFEIQGHVCCTPHSNEAVDKKTKKRELSKNRALTVFNFLKNKKIDPRRMTHKGYGNTKSLKAGQAMDRRVEFLITKI